jgi:hypothetical protein
MRKRVYFDAFDGGGWPAPKELAHYFTTPDGRHKFFESGNDSWGLKAEGADKTEHLQANQGRIDIDLTILGHREHGVLLFYHKWGGGHNDRYYSRGNMSRLREWIKTKDGDLMPIGLFISFETAWNAVKEFIETDGALPKSIAWIADRDVPADAFPAP